MCEFDAAMAICVLLLGECSLPLPVESSVAAFYQHERNFRVPTGTRSHVTARINVPKRSPHSHADPRRLKALSEEIHYSAGNFKSRNQDSDSARKGKRQDSIIGKVSRSHFSRNQNPALISTVFNSIANI